MADLQVVNQKNDPHSKFVESYKQIGPYLGLGFQLAASIVLMLFLGLWLDEKLEIYPILTIIFIFFGGAAGIYNVIKATIDLNKKNKN